MTGEVLGCLRLILQNGKQLLHILGPSLKNLKTFPNKIQTEPDFPTIFKLMNEVPHFDKEFSFFMALPANFRKFLSEKGSTLEFPETWMESEMPSITSTEWKAVQAYFRTERPRNEKTELDEYLERERERERD